MRYYCNIITNFICSSRNMLLFRYILDLSSVNGPDALSSTFQAHSSTALTIDSKEGGKKAFSMSYAYTTGALITDTGPVHAYSVRCSREGEEGVGLGRKS